MSKSPSSSLSDAEATTLHPSQRTLSPSGVDPSSHGWNLSQVSKERYLLEGVVAEGGHGRILRARDLHLERWVALKEPTSSGSSTQVRFLREARITARLQHPAIVPVYEAGRFPGGEPFYAMKLVSGRSLAHLIDSMGSLGERLSALPHVLAVADAMAYAHSQRVIHRDLKPSNVLVGEFAETVVIDWGLAKELGTPDMPGDEEAARAGSPGPEHTQQGTVMGTPAYMPPEQASGQPVDERADVYALGAILYHLLSGRAPYTGTTSQEVLQHVLSEEPVPLARLQPRLTQELLDIVSRAMEREPSRRYPTARELAEDLRRFQAGQYVRAHRYTLAEKLVRTVRQHRVAFVVASVLLVAMVSKAALDHRRIILERDRAELERDRAENRQSEATQRADSLVLLQARGAFAESPDVVLSHLDTLSPGFTGWGQVRILAAEALSQGLPMRLQGHTRAINHIEISPDGTQLATAGDDATLRLWDLRTGKGQVVSTYADEVWRTAFSPDGRYLASGGKDGLVRLWDKTAGTSRDFKGHTQGVLFMEFSGDGRFLFTSGYDGMLLRWEVASGASQLLGTHEGGVAGFKVLPGGKQLVAAGMKDKSVRLWDTQTGASQLLLSHPNYLTVLVSASQANVFAVGTDTGQVLWWPAPTAPVRTLECGTSSVSVMALSPDGSQLAAQSTTGPVRLWDLKASGPPRALEAAPSWKFTLNFSKEGRWLAAGGKDGKARLWETSTGQPRVLHGAFSTVSAVDFSPDGQWLVSASHDGSVRVHAVQERYPLTVTAHGKPLPENAVSLDWRHLTPWELRQLMRAVVSAVAFTPDGRHVLSAGRRDGMVRLSSLDGEPPIAVQAHAQGMTAGFVLPDGSRLATSGQDGTVVVWDAQARRLQELKGATGSIDVLSLSKDGAWVAAGTAQGEVWLWSTASGQGRKLGTHPQGLRALAFSADGQWLGSGSADGQLRAWQVASGEGRLLHSHAGEVVDVAFSPDSRLVASSSADHTLWIRGLDAPPGDPGSKRDLSGTGVVALRFSVDGREVFTSSLAGPAVMRNDVSNSQGGKDILGHQGSVLDLAVSPDGLRLLTASADGTARLWDLESNKSRALPGHQGPVLWVAFSPDGRQVLSAGQDGTVRVWPDELPMEPSALRAWVHTQATR